MDDTLKQVISVPDVPRPADSLWCWKQQTDPASPYMFSRCTLAIGHDTGPRPTPHSWETPIKLK